MTTSIQIKMRDELNPSTVSADSFMDIVNAIQLTRSKGMDFLILEKDDGNQKAFYIPNINTIDEVTDAF